MFTTFDRIYLVLKLLLMISKINKIVGEVVTKYRYKIH